MHNLLLGSFEKAGGEVLKLLRSRLGFDLWMITRTEGDDWIVLQSEDHGYGVAPGKVFSWADSFCCEMVQGNGPRIAPRSDAIPRYASAPIGRQVPIKAYIGEPLLREDGKLFGTLCAVDPNPQPDGIVQEQPLVQIFAALLSTILQGELRAQHEARRAERLEAESLTDGMTLLYNRRGWERLLDNEEQRCQRYGHPAAVLILDLDDLKEINDQKGHAAGDEIITRTAEAMRAAARSSDILARLGGDEFGILSIECNRTSGTALLSRTRKALRDAAIKASVGLCIRNPSEGLRVAWEKADEAMYQQKRSQAEP